jgi:hypothetical protein
VNERTASILLAISAGAALGAVALCIRYAPWPLRPGGAPAPVASSATAVAIEDASPPRGAASSLAAAAVVPFRAVVPRAERYARDPAVRAACPADMTLVDGEFCSMMFYSCARRSEDVGYRCAEYARGNRCMVPLERRRYCIDRHEWPNRPGENPLVYVDWHEAKSQCAAVGKRLCRRSEWILACEGPKRLPYPWGFVRHPSPCNIDRASIPFDVSAMLNEVTREVELARLWQADKIGSHPDCVSSFGAYDMAGNVDEWTDDQADNARTEHPSTLNGGYWGPVRDTCRLTTTSHGPSFKFYQVGFRCCGDTLDGVVVPPPRPFVEIDPKRRGAGAKEEEGEEVYE